MRTHGLQLGWFSALCIAGVAACSHDWSAFEPTGGSGGATTASGSGGGVGGGGATGSSSTAASSSTTSGPGGSGGAGGNGSGGAATVYASCKDLLAAEPAAPSGVATIDPDGPGGQAPFDVYCDMDSDGGGWTLALKVDGSAMTFGYDAGFWTNATVLNPGLTALDMTEAKLASFSSVPFDAVRVGLVTGSTNWLDINVTSSSLQTLFSGNPTPTSLGVPAWRGLVSSPSLESNCNLEGFNTQCGGSARVRLGIVANNQSDCNSCDSWIGVGGEGACGQTEVGAGNIACVGGDNGDKTTYAFAYLMVR